jgi:hypothetical protein
MIKKKIPTFEELKIKIEESKKKIEEEKERMDAKTNDRHGTFTGKAFITFKKVR